MWDMRRTVPKHIKIVHSSITLWQPLEFKTLPLTCFICRANSHLTHNCPRCPIKVEASDSDPIQRSDLKGKKVQTQGQMSIERNENTSNINELTKVLTKDTDKVRQKESNLQEIRNMELDNLRKRELDLPSLKASKRYEGSSSRSPRKYDPMDLSSNSPGKMQTIVR
jgi:hypothetical protein